MQEWLLSLRHFRLLLYAYSVVCPCVLKTHNPLLTHSRCEPFPLISRHVCPLRGNNPTPTALTMDLQSYLGLELVFLSHFLNIGTYDILASFIPTWHNLWGLFYLRIPQFSYLWNGENNLSVCIEYWSKFIWLISKMGRNNLIIFSSDLWNTAMHSTEPTYCEHSLHIFLLSFKEMIRSGQCICPRNANIFYNFPSFRALVL